VKTKTILVIAVLTLSVLAGDVLAASMEVTSARVAFKQGEYKRAIENLLKEIEKKPEVEAYYILASSYAELGDYKSAGEYFILAEKYMDTEKEVKKWAEDMELDRMKYWYAGFKVVQLVYKDAKSYLSDPESAPPGVTAESKFEEAISGFSNIDNIYPYHPRTRFYIGTAYEIIAGPVHYKHEDGALVEYKKGDDGEEQTREIYDADIKDLPMVKANEAYLISMEIKMDDMAGANMDADFPLEQHIVKVISCSAKLDNFDGALEVIDEAAKKFPDDPDVLYWEARIFETQGELSKAAELYEKVITKEGGEGFSDAYNALGDIYLNEDFDGRDSHKALEFLEKGLELAPDDFKIIISLGKTYREIGKTDESSEYLALGQTLYKIDKLAMMNAPQEPAVAEFGEPEEQFLMKTDYRGNEIEVDVAKFTFEDVTFYVQYYGEMSMGWSTARPTGSGE